MTIRRDGAAAVNQTVEEWERKRLEEIETLKLMRLHRWDELLEANEIRRRQVIRGIRSRRP